MIKLTSYYYKIKESALERAHKVNEIAESNMFDWEAEYEKSRSVGGEYPEKPYIETFDFTNDDYDREERRLRLRKRDIYSYRENEDSLVEITTSDGKTYIVKEDVEFFDNLFDKSLHSKG